MQAYSKILLSIICTLIGFILPAPLYAQDQVVPPQIFFPIWRTVPDQVQISEFMARNNSGLLDTDGEYSDWIELYNGGRWSVNLAGWHLTDKADDLTKWQFPEQIIASGEHLVVYASGKNQTALDGSLHTNFRLNGSGEYLALVKADGTTIASSYAPAYPPQLTDVTYGLDSRGQERLFYTPTPGHVNDTLPEDATVLSALKHSPASPQSDQPFWVTVQASGRTPVQVEIHYRIMFGPLQRVAMHDDGENEDGLAEDGIYGGMVDSALFQPNHLIRYAVVATDSTGHQASMPISLDIAELENYQAAIVADPTLTSTLPVMQWYVEDPEWYKLTDYPNEACLDDPECTCAEGDEDFCADPYQREHAKASLFYDGEFYDNIDVRIRGGLVVWLKEDKQSFKFDFNQNQPFRYSENYPRVEEININALWYDKSYIRNALGLELYQDVGVPASYTEHVLLYQNGEFHSLAHLVEQVDETFLRRHQLDDEGALYKIYNALHDTDPRPDLLPGQKGDTIRGVGKKTRKDEDNSDLQALIDGLENPDQEQVARYAFDNIDIPSTLTYIATSAIIGDRDMFDKNFYAYRNNANTGEWQMLPWDRDLGWGAFWQYDIVQPNSRTGLLYGPDRLSFLDAFYETDELQVIYLRRLRTVLDKWLQPVGTPTEQFNHERRLDEYLALLEADTKRDRAKWGIPEWPHTSNLVTEMADAIRRMKYDYLQRIRLTYYGDERLPAPQSELLAAWQGETPIRFGTIEASPASGKVEEAYIELQNQTDFAIDLSGWYLNGDVTYTLRPGVVLAAGQSLYISPNVLAFRQRTTSPMANEKRFVQGNYQGTLPDSQVQLSLYDTNGNLINTLAQ